MQSTLTQKTQQALDEYQTALSHRLPNKIEQIIWYGSTARGKTRKNSDLDIAIVVKKDTPAVHSEIIGTSLEFAVKYHTPISPIVLEKRELSQWSPFIENIKNEGKVLWKEKKKNSQN